MKGMGMFVVLPRGVKYGFWTHLGVCNRTAIILAIKDL